MPGEILKFIKASKVVENNRVICVTIYISNASFNQDTETFGLLPTCSAGHSIQVLEYLTRQGKVMGQHCSSLIDQNISTNTNHFVIIQCTYLSIYNVLEIQNGNPRRKLPSLRPRLPLNAALSRALLSKFA